MISPKEFNYYLKAGIIVKSSQNKSRADFLIKESELALEGLNERVKLIGINEKNVNSLLKDSYDILMSLLRAKLLLDGYSSSGNYSHEGEIAYLKELNFPDVEINFLNELRYLRNGVIYYGKCIDNQYLTKVLSFVKHIYPKLHKLAEGKLK